MFSTFTGSSRRPRNVNLSGQAGNPFANTSWSPAVVSNASKTVSDAQAEREKRQLERQRLKAAGRIQRVWRGHRSRRDSADRWRAIFDQLYSSSHNASYSERAPIAFNLLIAFYSARRSDDVRRVCLYCEDAQHTTFDQIAPRNAHVSRFQQLMAVLVGALNQLSQSANEASTPAAHLIKLIIRITKQMPETITKSTQRLYSALAQLCKAKESARLDGLLAEAVISPLRAATGDSEFAAYKALAFNFLAHSDLTRFERHIETFSKGIETAKLSRAIRAGYSAGTHSRMFVSKDDQLWLLAHFIDLSRLHMASSDKFEILGALLPQLSSVADEASTRAPSAASPDASPDTQHPANTQSASNYTTQQLGSLVDKDGISRLLRDLSDCLTQGSKQTFQGTSILSGYILTLLQVFPSSADDIRMRLFLEQIPTSSGTVPTVKFLWEIMKHTSVFQKLKSELERPTDMLRRYLHGSSNLSDETMEEQEWRTVLLFLELYVFILRLSDDEDFFSGMESRIVESNSSTSLLRSCSLSLEDVKALTIFLKNTAFALHYKANEISKSDHIMESTTSSRLDSYLGADVAFKTSSSNLDIVPAASPARANLDSLRTILTTALRMLYERDSRKRFLPPNHWLMTGKLEQEDFINAVIVEEERQNQEEAEGSDDEVAALEPVYGESGIYSTLAGQRLSRHARLERLRAEQVRRQRERKLAEMGPKLEILKHMPFVVPFETRVKIFRQFVHLDTMRREGNNPFHMFPPHPSARHHAKIRRGQLFDDAYEQFYQLGDGLKDPIQITFVDQFGTPEAGIDGGGVTKEFLTSVTSEAFQSELGMFTSNEQGLLFPNPTATDTRRDLLHLYGLREEDDEFKEAMTNLFKRFEFLGRIVGKCMYEGILVDLAFAGFFLLKWPSLGPKDENTYKGSINGLRDMDAELYQGMLTLKNYPGDVSGLGFDFTVEDQVSPPGQPVKTITRKLIANGDQTPVTNDNRLLYISYMARHRLVVQPSLQTAAFLRGLRAIIKPSWLSMFNQSELQRLVGGDSSEIDIEDLRRNTVYSGLYEIGDDNEEHPTIKLFWKVMEGFTDSQRRDVLKYVSSTPRAPLLGFSQLRPKFSIRDGGTDEQRLPSTSTCVNLLKLPRYSKEETLRERLLYAVTSGAGFDLS
ncbi:HECT-type E3 ubiquitin transferase [Purpureocillium takamizusanense]|uniref:HECT-type E3 ubiquitin transferase n=1 Tax=Purpureocillium takamizusanense TaxID=2060973 RepID=A0A9Q8VEG8_9HYPO|nr:HECT-type E3 ubiquitin transferase [Purpureocillium takamizusanense]UNI22623.1 HECT-type E3 ubiquitin transferase [Purpureocillium takamizusanense]